MTKSFKLEISEQLGVYVYRLIDPRNGETFYVGKGKGDRIFNHNKEVEDLIEFTNDDDRKQLEMTLELKHKRIVDIKNSGNEVIHLIHRYIPFGKNSSYTEDEAKKIAFEVESALIDAYAGLTNKQAGYCSDRGCQSIIEIQDKFAKDVITEFHHKVVAITINKSSNDKDDIYECVRGSWVLSPEKAKDRYVLAERNGIVVGVFQVKEWLQDEKSGRWFFNGEMLQASKSETDKTKPEFYFNKRLPNRLRGASNPIRYFDESFDYEKTSSK